MTDTWGMSAEVEKPRRASPVARGAVNPFAAGYRVTETQFQTQVIELAHVLGYRVAHFRPAQTSRGWRTPVQADCKGFPDLILCKPGRLLAVELKAEKKKPSAEQEAWLEWFREAGASTYLWHPSDWERIVEVLRD